MIATLGVSVAAASVIYYVETFIPFPLPVGRWGFSNSVVLFFAANFGLKSAVIIATGKSILGALVTGRFMSPGFIMGIFGSLSAATVEWALFKLKFGYIGSSLAGSLINNLTQMFIGSFLIGSYSIFSFLPIFIITGSISAVVNSYLAKSYENIWGRIP